MSYQALYRQWRPLDFDEIIGQDHITSPLKNQITSKTYGHAYIFSGTRGTGKTSTAKIFARAVNCLDNTTGNPCNVCENCLSILEDQFIDVVEMDAASNNSVDDIRELREHVKFAPSKGKYKVYIIDEVHMLSQGAFNALLKTLEEPPEYVIFILATTEAQKIPATILSRCQRFDFKRISYENILKRLEYICKKIDVEYETEALKLIIQKSDGAVRDSLSSLDQCLSVGGNHLTIENVVDVLGVVEKTQIVLLVQFLTTKQTSESLMTVDNVLRQGKDLNQFLNGLIEVYRDLLIVKMVENNYEALINASDEYIQSLVDVVGSITPTQITRSLDLLIELSKSMKYSQNKRIVFEATIIKLINPEVEVNYDAMMERIERIEKTIASGQLVKATPRVIKEAVESAEPVKPVVTEAQKVEEFIEFTDQDISLENVKSIWQTFIETLKSEKKGIHPILENSEPILLKGNRCIVSVTPENKMFLGLLVNASNTEYLNGLASKLVKKSLTLDYEVAAEPVENKDSEEAQIMDYFKDYKNVLEIK
ncbi:MAG: DNA polymerase III subunit gamma/tau [Bacillota bacterium]|jgi:DNA polymerase-3 subunit gamma/tau|nr:DNA polymerase III subunit gamma/tau [Bacillota bacterium]